MSQDAIRAVLHTAAGAGVADAELLERFVATRDESAFELLLWRHGAFVQRVCKSVLRDHHAAEDAAQATFLVLARKAHTFASRGSVVGWLYRIARRIAMRAAQDRSRRVATTAELDRLPGIPTESDVSLDEIAALCEEVDRLPERYRVPVLLCFFEGLTHAEAASRTGWPIGTVAGRLARAKDLLSQRLSKKGVGVAAVVLGLPASGFVSSTAHAAVAFATKSVVPGIELHVIHLAEGALKTMTGSTWKLTAAVVAVVCVVSGVTAAIVGFAPPPVVPPVPPPPAPVAAPVPQKKDTNERIADAKQRARSQNNLKQIMIAMLNYHDANDHFPQNVVDKNGKPLLSWRVLLLPYIEQTQLYMQFKLDEPWDSENNGKLLTQMPDVFRVGFEPKDEIKTYYQGFAGPGTLFEPGKKLKIGNITDGVSNTLAVVEAGPPVEWTKPADIPYDPKNPLPKLDGPFSNTLIVAAADGETRPLRRDIDEKTLRRLIEVADGEPVSVEDLRGKFPLTPEDIEAAKKLLAQNEKLMNDIATELKEQQKLILEIAKQSNAKGVNGVDFDLLSKMQLELTLALGILKKKTEELKEQLEEAKKEQGNPKK
jgi:RNA polymerase sigma factor (sigma-70 family)